MRFYDIALFLFIFNMTIGFVNELGLTSSFYTSVGGWGTADVTGGREKMESTIGEKQEGLFGELNWLVENVRLVVHALGAFFKIFMNATIFSRGMYTMLLCTGGVDCSFNSPMGMFVNMLYGLTLFVYTIALVQFAMGRSIKEVE